MQSFQPFIVHGLHNLYPHQRVVPGISGISRNRSHGPMSLEDYAVPKATGPLDVLYGQDVLCLADVQNLTASSSKFDCKFSYGQLATLLRGITGKVTFHAFFAASEPDSPRIDYFKTRGWTPHVYPVHHVRTHRGTERRSNIDTLLAVVGGALVSRSNASVVVIASGDGQLVSDFARAVAMFPKPRKIVTLSMAGSTSWQVHARTNPLIAANIEIGHDLLRQGRSVA